MKVLRLFSLILLLMFGIAGHAAAETVINAYLYNPSTDKIVLHYPYDRPSENTVLKPTLKLRADGFADGKYRLFYAIEANGKRLFSDETAVEVWSGSLDLEIELKEKFANAERVSWRLVGPAGESLQGVSPLAWSRFHGRVRYLKGVWRSTSIELFPEHFGENAGVVTVPVADDGTFDALVPALVYAVLNVNGAGYGYDTLERWGWNYDLRRDREDLFTVGSTEIYGAREFHVLGGPSNMIFVFFRPTSMGRLHRFDADQDGILNEAERKAQGEAMKDSPTAIGPELTAKDIRILVDGKPLPILQVDRIPEAQGDGRWQVDYLVQCSTAGVGRPKEGAWSAEIKIEVTSQEIVHGEKVTDFGESSVDYLLRQ